MNNNNLGDSRDFRRDCSICLEKLYSNIIRLNCNHYFHEKCINDWQKRNNNCPICRSRILKIEQVMSLNNICYSLLYIIAIIIISIPLLKCSFGNIFSFFDNLMNVPYNFIYKFFSNLVDILLLLLIIVLKICKKMIFNVYAFIKDIFETIWLPFELIIQFMENIKNKLRKIIREI